MNKLEVRQAIMSGTPLSNVPDDERTLVRGWLQDIAGESIDNGQDIYAVIALNEVKKLDELTRSAQLHVGAEKRIQAASFEEEKCLNCHEYDCRCNDYDRAQLS